MAQEQKRSGGPDERSQQPPKKTQEERFEENREQIDIDSTTRSDVSMHDDERTAANASDESLAVPNPGSGGSNNAPESESEISEHDDPRTTVNQSDEQIEGNQTSGGLDRDEQRRAAGKGTI